MDILQPLQLRWMKWRSFGVAFLAIISTLFIFAIMREQLLYAVAFLSGYSFAKPLPMHGLQGGEGHVARLKFRRDGTFKISIFEDLHFGEGEDNPPELGWGPPSDRKSIKVMNTILDSEKPDLVVLNGDLITGENTYIHNSTHYLDQIVDPLVRRQIPWASTYGNHDQQFNLSTTDLLLRERTKYGQLSLTLSMFNSPEAGVTNYVLPVYNSDGHSYRPVLLLWFFDSKGGSKFQEQGPNGERISVPGVVDESVAHWFSATNAALTEEYGHMVPSVAFVHIPVFAMAAFQTTSVDAHAEPGINDDNPLAPQAIKNNTYTGEDIPFMKSLVETDGMMAVFSGHDHGNDWCFKWNLTLPGMTVAGSGLFLCFGRHSGYGGYGSWTRGSRQILFREHSLKEIETWNRLEDKTLSGWVMLNETYGNDQYPTVNRTFT